MEVGTAVLWALNLSFKLCKISLLAIKGLTSAITGPFEVKGFVNKEETEKDHTEVCFLISFPLIILANLMKK